MSLTSSLRIDSMQLADIPQVVAVEKAAYTMHWPVKAYEHELTQNKSAHYFSLRVQPSVASAETTIIGMAGFWLLADEAHISTIAVYPNWQNRGLGEWLLITLLQKAVPLGAVVATLEVRPSNLAALALYQKYQFEEVGRRKKYYADNNEDALILTTPSLLSTAYQSMLSQREAALFLRLEKIDLTGE